MVCTDGYCSKIQYCVAFEIERLNLALPKLSTRKKKLVPILGIGLSGCIELTAGHPVKNG